MAGGVTAGHAWWESAVGGGVAGAVTLQGPAAALCSHLHLGGPEGVRLSESPEAAAGARNQARGTRAPCYCWGGAACFSISASALGAPEVLVADLRKIPSSYYFGMKVFYQDLLPERQIHGQGA